MTLGSRPVGTMGGPYGMFFGRRWNYLSRKKTFATQRWATGEQLRNMEYAGHHNIYTAYGAIILLCPLSSKRKKQKQMNFKLHINMNLSPDPSCFEVTEISVTNWLNALILLIKSKHLRWVEMVRWKGPKQLQRWCACTVVAEPGQCGSVDWQVMKTCTWICTARLWQQALANTMSMAGLTFVGGKGKCFDVTRRDGTEK